MLVLKGIVGLHRTVQLQLLQGYWYESANVSELYLPYSYMVLNFFIRENGDKDDNTCSVEFGGRLKEINKRGWGMTGEAR